MSLNKFERSSLWKRTLAYQENDEFEKERGKLRQAFFSLREKCEMLVEKISATLPDLTQHNINHLDALWEVASLIIGDDFPINPLEGFILGSSFLLHDSALCPEAYNKGIEGLRDTLYWKDTFAQLVENNDHQADILKKESDFLTLRELHASQSEKLLTENNWIGENENVFLLDDSQLRNHYGSLIGKISASHNWNIEEVISKLKSQINPISPYPREWSINPIKLAFILRCADAAHIDNDRAPDFLLALIKRSNSSLLHWKAQNNLSSVTLDNSDLTGETILFTSNKGFSEEEYGAWYIAYDAISVVNREINDCNSFLMTMMPPLTFKIKRVKGADSIESMAAYIEAIGWKPCSANVHISNIENIIRNFGGQELYGRGGKNNLIVAIRELIQNSRDAIKARETIEKLFEGKILINFEKKNDDYYITISDNGVGMSERVLTGSLLDFGKSFWSSELIKSEFPGLKSSNFKPVGKFGIGFYSIFMVSRQVEINTRLWNKGKEDVKVLSFKDGFTLRPILKFQNHALFNSFYTTRVRLKLENILDDYDRFQIQYRRNNEIEKFEVPLKAVISRLTAGLDVDVFYAENEEEEQKIHSDFNTEFDKYQWLRDIAYADYRNNSRVDAVIKEHLEKLDYIDHNNKTFGLIAFNRNIDQSIQNISVATVGGLNSSPLSDGGTEHIGLIDYDENSARREIDHKSRKAATENFHQWAFRQYQSLLVEPKTLIQYYRIASFLFDNNIDSLDFTLIPIRYNESYSLLTKTTGLSSLKNKEIFILVGTMTEDLSIPETQIDYAKLPNKYIVTPLNLGKYSSVELIDGKPANENSLLGSISRLAKIEGLQVRYIFIENLCKSTMGLITHAIRIELTDAI
ncbi:HD domain-containing protein [Arachidicoccus sp.]|uniref:HD domain-containing protein n=1 Tax=Arachidicoccus sp. TaxID=1872624 RepID=UPI003D1CD12A